MPEKPINKIVAPGGSVFRAHDNDPGNFFDDKGLPLPDEIASAILAGEVPEGYEASHQAMNSPNLANKRISRFEPDIGHNDDSGIW